MIIAVGGRLLHLSLLFHLVSKVNNHLRTVFMFEDVVSVVQICKRQLETLYCGTLDYVRCFKYIVRKPLVVFSKSFLAFGTAVMRAPDGPPMVGMM